MAGSDALIGQAVTHYRILQRPGGGVMAVVYKAQDTRLDGLVVLSSCRNRWREIVKHWNAFDVKRKLLRPSA